MIPSGTKLGVQREKEQVTDVPTQKIKGLIFYASGTSGESFGIGTCLPSVGSLRAQIN